jgi:hypothetical protein
VDYYRPIFPELHNQREFVRAWWKSIQGKQGGSWHYFFEVYSLAPKMVDPTLTLVLPISICKQNMGTHRVVVSEHAVPASAKIKN